MKPFVVGVVSLLAGLLLGQMVPAGQIAQLEEEIAELRDGGGAERTASQEVASQFARSLMRPAEPCDPVGELSEEPDREPADMPIITIQTEADDDDSGLEDGFDSWDGDLATLPDAEQLDMIAETARFRTDQYRNQLINGAALNDDEIEQLDQQLADMNANLLDQADELFVTMAAGEEPDSLEMLTALRDMTDTLVVGAEGMRDLASGSEGSLGEEALDPFNYIDPAPFLSFLNELEPSGEGAP